MFRKHASASSLPLLLSPWFLLLVLSFHFGRTISNCRTSIPPPSRCSRSLILASLLPVYMHPSHLPLLLARFLSIFFSFFTFCAVSKVTKTIEDSACFPRPQPWWLWVNDPDVRGELQVSQSNILGKQVKLSFMEAELQQNGFICSLMIPNGVRGDRHPRISHS